MTFPIYGKIKHVPNHQPVMAFSIKNTNYFGDPMTMETSIYGYTHSNKDRP